MTLEQILEKLHDPNEHAVTFELGELTKLLEELQAARELIRRQAQYIENFIDTGR